MELALMLMGLIGLAFAGRVAGADSRRHSDDGPYGAI